MFCTQCGAELKDGAIFCTQCGSKIDNTSQVNNENLKESVIGKSFSFTRNLFSYINKTTIVTFENDSLAIGSFKPKKILYNQIEDITIEDKLNFGEFYFLIACIVILVSGLVNGSVGSIIVAIVVGIPSIFKLKNIVVSIRTFDNKINKIVMTEKETEKDNFFKCLEIMQPYENAFTFCTQLDSNSTVKNKKSIGIVVTILLVVVMAIIGTYNYPDENSSSTTDDVEDDISNSYQDKTKDIHNYTDEPDENSSFTIYDVKNGVLHGYGDETIGEAFEDYFYDCSWDSYILRDGNNSIDMVEFTGYIYDCKYDWVKVLVQFEYDGSDDTANDINIYCIKIGDECFNDHPGDILSTVYSDGDCSYMHRGIFTDFE